MFDLESERKSPGSGFFAGVGGEQDQGGFRYGHGEDGMREEKVTFLIYILFWVWESMWGGVGGL